MTFKSYAFLCCIVLYSNQVLSQYCTTDDRFTEVEYFAEIEISSLSNVTYATDVIDGLGEIQDLDMDVYFPSAANETLAERPFVLLLHGGG